MGPAPFTGEVRPWAPLKESRGALLPRTRPVQNTRTVCVVRRDGSWWLIERGGAFLMRQRTKRLATLTGRLLDGDVSAAPAWYRATLEEARRTQRDELGALRAAVLAARELGLGPEHVRTDASGRPLD